ncbi:hypothetical protein [Streptomyces sp. NPDC059564]|uniref:hypothetical protein n=1 Tax=Streptomyces sp. NPDC059564 TaxID=3346865 RepID=UPI0036C65581
MNRHARYALLAPLLVTAVAMPSTMAHAAAPAAPAAAPQAACALVAAPNTNPQEFDLTLTGFRANQNVGITGPEQFTVTTDQQGNAKTEDVKKGNYTAKPKGGQGQGNQNRSVGCTKPARGTTTTTTVRITDVDVAAPATNPEVDCSVPQSVTFTGKLTGTGTGEVEVFWQGNSKASSPLVKFTAPDTSAGSFTSKSNTRSAPTQPAPVAAAQLTVGKVSDSTFVTLKCKTGT